MKKNVLFMAFAKGSETKEVEIKRYIGIGTVKVLGINPTAAQIKEWMGYEPKEAPVYTGVQENNGEKIKYARVAVVVRTIPEKCNGIETTQMINFFVRNQIVKGSQSGKYQIIDEYGRTAWADKSDIDARNIPTYSNGPANISANYKPLYVGQEDLVNFLRTYLGIGSVMNHVNGTWVMKQGDDAKDCIGGIDDMPALLNGNFSEVTDAIALQPNNKVKALFGITHNANNGNDYQTVYPSMILRPGVTDYTKIMKHIEERKAAGALSSHTYEFCDLKEYTVQPTDFSDAPLGGAPETGATPW